MSGSWDHPTCWLARGSPKPSACVTIKEELCKDLGALPRAVPPLLTHSSKRKS